VEAGLGARPENSTRQYAATTFNNAQAEHAAFGKEYGTFSILRYDGDPDRVAGPALLRLQTYHRTIGENADLNALCKGLTGEVYFWLGVSGISEIYTHG